jgi:very-short-patch-repair endonuclease
MAALAARQHGVVTSAQLQTLGFTRDEIAHRLACGRLVRLHRGVYAVGHAAVSQRGRELAAVLACGPGAVLSHRSAAGLWGFGPTWRGEPEVTVTRRRRARVGLRLRHTGELAACDMTRRVGIAVTALARTLVDLAAILTAARLERAIGEAELLRLVTEDDFLEAVARLTHRRGAGRLAAVLRAERAVTRSGLERLFAAALSGSDLPWPETNQYAAGLEVDALWREQRLVVELDCYEVHRIRPKFERDRLRDLQLQKAGYRVVRLTDRTLARPEEVRRHLRSLLAA